MSQPQIPTALRNYRHAAAHVAYKANTHELEREQLIEAHLPQVRFIADRLAMRLPPSVDRDDLISAGTLGLLDAVDKFDATRAVKFKTYAETRVRGAMLDFLRSLDWSPRSLRRKAREIETTYAQLEQEKNRPATEDEVAARLNLSLPEFQQILNDLRSLTITNALDDDNVDDNFNHLTAQVADTATPSPYQSCEHRNAQAKLVAAIDRLPERERQVVALYYLEELTMKEVGVVLNLTESRVSQLHTQAVLRLRSTLHNTHAAGVFTR